MSIPTALHQTIEDAVNALCCHPQHDLNLGYRQAIWAVFGPRIDVSQMGTNSGYKRRVILSILTARHVLPIWEGVWPDDDTPYRLLKNAEQVLKGTFDVKMAQDYRDEVWTKLENLASKPDRQSLEYQKPISAGFSAINALCTALQDEEFDSANINCDLTDTDVDAYDNDSSFWAAAAYANGGIWEPKSDAVKRREFWDWWLTKAVPSAWQAVL